MREDARASGVSVVEDARNAGRPLAKVSTAGDHSDVAGERRMVSDEGEVGMKSGALRASTDLYTQTLSGFLQVGVKDLYRFKQGFSVFPNDIAARKDINAGAKMALLAMAIEAKGTGVCSASDEVLARLSGQTRPTIVKARGKLEAVGLTRKHGLPVQQVQAYELLHPRFRSDHAGEKAEGPPSDLRKRLPWKPCKECGRLRPQLPENGVCRTCKSVNHVAAIADRRIDKRIEELQSAVEKTA